MLSGARTGRDFVARHGETVFNAAARLQGEITHTPLTRAGFAQAEELGRALRRELGARPPLTLWSSPTGRTLQTLAIVAEHLELDWHAARTDARLGEIGMGRWGGRGYAEYEAEAGSLIDERGLLRVADGGETYPEVAQRLSGWLADTAGDAGDRLVLTHGIASRVLRALLTGAPVDRCGAPVLPAHPQGTVTVIARGTERVVHLGTGAIPA